RPPDGATLSRTPAGMDEQSVAGLRDLNRKLVLDRLRTQVLRRAALDFDGSVLATGRFAEGATVGFNRKKKGQRRYDPLFCTVAQLGQALDAWHRPGNVHDSRDAQAFIRTCIQAVREALPRCVIQVRLDRAFF